MVATPEEALKEPWCLRPPGDLGRFRVLEGDLLESHGPVVTEAQVNSGQARIEWVGWVR